MSLEVSKRVKNFIWTTDVFKISLVDVSWMYVCTPKQNEVYKSWICRLRMKLTFFGLHGILYAIMYFGLI